MTVNDVLEKVNEIDRLFDTYKNRLFDSEDIKEILDFLAEYKEELLSKKIAMRN